jgi:predicted flavoprotein YhiN
MSSRGEAVVTRWGLEGGAIYALSSRLRDELDRGGTAEVRIDLRPDVPEDVLDRRLAGPRHGRSLANILRQRAGLSPVGSGLVQEALHSGPQPESLGALIKAVPVHVTAVQTIERAISSAGGIIRDEWDDRLMLNRLPGVFVAGEMLDWEAPTGGYLLQACFSTGRWAARGMQTWLQANK